MIITKTLKPGEVGYTVDIIFIVEDPNNPCPIQHERYNGYSNFGEAKIVAESLINNESGLMRYNSKNILYVTVQKVTCDENDGDFTYNSLGFLPNAAISPEFNDIIMRSDAFFEVDIKPLDSCIYDFSICEDKDSEGHVINICWLKLGYVSPSSNCGFFHFSSLSELLTLLSQVKIYRECGPKEQEEYMFWLASNTCLFKSKDSEKMIEDIARMCFQQETGQLL